MKTWLYWIVATAMLALVVHLFIVIFVPGVDMGQKMARIAASGNVNELHVLDATASGDALITEPNPDLTYAYCAFDLSRSAVEIDARIPPVYWSISIYSSTADNIYTLNDVQAGLSSIKLLVVEAGKEVRLAAGPDGQPDNTIIVESPSRTGLILLRAFAGDASKTSRVLADLAASSCFERNLGPPRAL
jgi:uncharacterized membrane protein